MTIISTSFLLPAERVQVDIEHVPQLVAAVLNGHTDENGFCAAYPGVTFPCERPLLAEHNLAVLQLPP